MRSLKWIRDFENVVNKYEVQSIEKNTQISKIIRKIEILTNFEHV